ncbi:MAG: ATP-dependent helicase [Burkholderiales bacterium]|nr:ATP-dependent helicase [Burkholderiales bacterium]
MSTANAPERLNPAQLRAARHGARDLDGSFRAGPLLIVAGAGTGKTNTLAHRVAHLLLEGVEPARILLLTFSRRAAAEMIRRAQRVAGAILAERSGGAPGAWEQVRLPWSGTFHSIANRLIRVYCRGAGLEPEFSVLDRGDAADLLDIVRHDLAFDRLDRRFPRKDTCLAIYSHKVNTQGALGDTLARHFPWCAQWEAELTRLFRAYVERKLSMQALDYDDLLLYLHAMLADAGLAREIGGRFDHVLVDEYQDTNALQAGILLRLRPDGSGVTAVGDDAQAIYSFRAATVENMLSFPARFSPPATVVALEENYRSTQCVLDAANAVIAGGARRYRKDLRATRGRGERPRYVTVADEQAQAEYVLACVLEALERGLALRRQAVLFRSAHHADLLELELVRRNVPYVKYGGLKFLEAAHVRDLLAVLRWADNPRNRLAAFRALKLLPAMGPARADRAWTRFEASGWEWGALPGAAPRSEDWIAFAQLMVSLAAHEEPWQGQVAQVREWYEPYLEERYEAAQVRAADLVQLERVAEQFATRERFLTELALDPPQASGDLAGTPRLDEDWLVLSTVHSAKGQEWGAVYVLNVADGSFPSEFAGGRAEAIEEERRLLYVAMTRAKTDLHLVAPLRYYVTQQRAGGERHVYGARSRFVTPAVLKCMEEIAWPGAGGAVDARGAGPRVDVAGALREMWR